MSIDLGALNWLAIAAATVAYFVLGGVWFIPKVFGDVWMRAIDWQPTEGETPGAAVYLGPVATSLIASITLAVLVVATGAEGAADGLKLGLLAGVGIAGTVLFLSAHFDPKTPKPMVWFAIMAGYHTVGIVIASVILAAWR